MSEFNRKSTASDCRWKLLLEASALALIGYATANSVAAAQNSGRPTVWIEFGGQLSRWENSQEAYAPPFASLTPDNLSPPQDFEKTPRYGVDESASLLLQPSGADWIFSASIRYGRSGDSRHVHQQSDPAPMSGYVRVHRVRPDRVRDFVNYYPKYPVSPRFVDVVSKQSESHTLLDFQVGKDIGVGLFGHAAHSILNVGVRFAQFTSRSRANLRENPDWPFKTEILHYSTYYSSSFNQRRTMGYVNQQFHSFAGTFLASRSFNGLGPSLSWSSSESVAGNPERGELTFDWNLNAALLFGHQKAKVHHQTTGRYHTSHAAPSALPATYQRTPVDHTRSRGVIVPNIGAFAGLSVKYPDAKITFGYKADFLFGAMDGGIDVRRTEDVGFHGPYASVSIGLGG